MQHLTIKQQGKLKGVYRFTKAKLETPEHFALDAKILAKRNRVAQLRELQKKAIAGKQMIGRWIEAEHREMRSLIHALHKSAKLEHFMFENLVVDVGLQNIADNISSATPDNSPLISYAELGDDNTPPAAGDTALGNGVYRNAIASRTSGGGIAYATAFYSATEVDGHFYEAGIFCDGSGTIGTGVLLSHVAIDINKSDTESLTLDWSLEFVNA